MPIKLLTDLLDVLGLLLLAAGAAAAVFPFIGWVALLLAGVVVLGGSQLADAAHTARNRTRRRGEQP
ncbi:hypothetical protein [Micromonospora sp. RTP1Z1]|uniref:hypothetical protein n=1 Tax=Micromonospora sp. RTP1Z1 TaxID=2994043 RepID=UPI0029C8B6FD|nr:hypothetical protein [Micromonospora sp. RTP1Z1]